MDKKYRIIETQDGRFFPQVFDYLWGSQSWLFIIEYRAIDGNPARYSKFKYEIEPIGLSDWCRDKQECERILTDARTYFTNQEKDNIGSGIKKTYSY
jgi:hypothetical protein